MFLMFRKPRGLQPHAWAITRVLRYIPRSLARFHVFNVTVLGRNKVPKKGRAIIACNHLSVADPVFLWGAVRRNAVAIAMAELWRIPGINMLMWLLGQIPIKRGNSESGRRAVAAGQRILEHDGLLFIYPEGKCSKDGTLLKFYPGVAELAFATNAPVVPAAIKGSNVVKPLHSWRINRRHPVRLLFGDPIDPQHFTGPAREELLLAELRRQILRLSA